MTSKKSVESLHKVPGSASWADNIMMLHARIQCLLAAGATCSACKHCTKMVVHCYHCGVAFNQSKEKDEVGEPIDRARVVWMNHKAGSEKHSGDTASPDSTCRLSSYDSYKAIGFVSTVDIESVPLVGFCRHCHEMVMPMFVRRTRAGGQRPAPAKDP